MKGRDLIAYLSYLYDGNWEEIYEAIKSKQRVTEKEIEDFLSKENIGPYLTLVDAEYPSSLKKISRPPFVLYYKGDLSLISDDNYDNCLAIVGSRNSSKYGEDSVQNIVEKLTNNVIIVSGLAIGIDKIAHQSALFSNKKTVAVLGSGIGNCYPKENESLLDEIVNKGGLIISEYPFNVEASKDNFLFRNRLIAAFGKAVLVGEAHLRSGTSRTVNYAINCGKDVGCIPYPLSNDGIKSGCNRLIKDGSYLIEDDNDIYDLLGINRVDDEK